MTSKNTPFYITTPIYYVNDRPHIGHTYTTTVCDVVARYHRFLGRDVFFLTGTDEHGLKVEKSAKESGITPQEQADKNAAEYVRVFDRLGISNDDFIRTTQPRHTEQVQGFVKRLIDSGDVYIGEYEGWYDEGQEEYVTETKAVEQDYKSAISGRPLVRAKERNYFFRLSAFQERLEKLLEEHPEFVRPVARRNEVLGRLREGLQDIPMSRTNFAWGIPVPGDESHVIYVWVDALFNYISALGIGEGERPENERRGYWPAQYHVIGKEILFFHAVIWPAMLMALDIPVPHCVYAHSFWISEGQKMSKSLGNFIDLEMIDKYIDEFSLDAFRYYLVTNGPMGATDADFAHTKFTEVYNADLANTLGNAINRVTNMINKYFDGTLPAPGDYAVDGFDWPVISSEAVAEATSRMGRLELTHGLAAGLDLVRQVNGYIDVTRPFTMAKNPDEKEALGTVLYNCIEGLRIASLILWCALPEKMAAFWTMLDVEIDPNAGNLETLAQWGTLQPGSTITKGDPLFPRHVAD